MEVLSLHNNAYSYHYWNPINYRKQYFHYEKKKKKKIMMKRNIF